MYRMKDNIIKISVRNLVEFILRSGDIDNRYAGKADTEAMQEGSKTHRMIQKQMGSNYDAEVMLSINIPVTSESADFVICVEGRADGILHQDTREVSLIEEDNPMIPSIVIDEIKGVYFDINHLEEPIKVHQAQAMCYAYIYASQQSLDLIGVRLTYCNMDTKAIRYFEENFSYEALKTWFDDLIHEYGKWACWQYEWILSRNESIKNINFPFAYRSGQKELVTGVYRSILRNKKIFIEAPTGVGKTISTVFPAVKAMGEGLSSKIFYLTAKTITRTVAEETYRILIKQGLHMKIVTLTAKDKICILKKADCNPISCEHAKGHYDRVNDAVYDMLINEEDISRDLILEYADKHQVCPFEMSLDVTTWADSIICDYNYAFDPNVYLRRFFVNEKKNDYIFLIDEAHNLVERGREMYSAELFKDHFLEIKRIIKTKSNKFTKILDICNKDLLKLKRECDDFKVLDNISEVILHLMRLLAEEDEFLQEYKVFEERDKVLQLYFDVRHFLNIFDLFDEKYVIYSDYDEDEGFRLRLQCMDPSTNLLTCLEKGRSAVFFSATLLPIQYYKDQLGGNLEDYAVYAPSPFDTKNRVLMIANDVSTKYTRRTKKEYEKIVGYIKDFTKAQMGNYLVFFPSYQLMNGILDILREDTTIKDDTVYEITNVEMKIENEPTEIIVQRSNMSETKREEFLEHFALEPTHTRIGFCVMGGIFSEGIDLKEDRLIGAVIVGTGLPMVCNERELFRNYYNEKTGKGFDYAYLYNGMNKVLQSAGRVIRTSEDKGAILLLDERFSQKQYKNLYPKEWYPNITVNQSSMKKTLEEFWENEN